ncbi:uncharacterized, partial [Tachysurus ichikawai]
MGDWTYSPAAFVNLLHSFSPFRTNKAGCIRSHEGGSLAAHQAAGCPQENGEAAGEGRCSFPNRPSTLLQKPDTSRTNKAHLLDTPKSPLQVGQFHLHTGINTSALGKEAFFKYGIKSLDTTLLNSSHQVKT